ncbi:hypothetical protein CPB86DRAFT_665152, partial [Serendipita vermifera]
RPPTASRPASAASSTRSGSASTRGRFFRPVPYSTTLALQQFIDGGSDTSITTKPTPVKRGAGSSSRPRYASPSPASTRRDQVQSEVGRGHSLPVVDEKGQVWMDWEEKQEYAGLMEETRTGVDESGDWVNFKPTDGRESEDESPKRIYDPSSRQLLDAFAFRDNASTSSPPLSELAPDQPAPRPKGKARIRRVRTSESLRAGSAPIVIPPVPSQHHTNKPNDDAVQEFVQASFDPPSFLSAATQEEDRRLSTLGKRGSLSLKNFARKL